MALQVKCNPQAAQHYSWPDGLPVIASCVTHFILQHRPTNPYATHAGPEPYPTQSGPDEVGMDVANADGVRQDAWHRDG